MSQEIMFGLQLSFCLGLSLGNAVCTSDWTSILAHAKKIVSDNFKAGVELAAAFTGTRSRVGALLVSTSSL